MPQLWSAAHLIFLASVSLAILLLMASELVEDRRRGARLFADDDAGQTSPYARHRKAAVRLAPRRTGARVR